MKKNIEINTKKSINNLRRLISQINLYAIEYLQNSNQTAALTFYS